MDECVVVRKNIALRMVIEHSSSKKKSACKEVDTYKVDGAAFLVVSWGTKSQISDMIPYQNQATIKLTTRCETLKAMILRVFVSPSVFLESVSSADSGLLETGLVGSLSRSATPLPSSTMRKSDEGRTGILSTSFIDDLLTCSLDALIE